MGPVWVAGKMLVSHAMVGTTVRVEPVGPCTPPILPVIPRTSVVRHRSQHDSTLWIGVEDILQDQPAPRTVCAPLASVLGVFVSQPVEVLATRVMMQEIVPTELVEGCMH